MTAPASNWEQIAAHEGGTVNGLATVTAADGSVRVYAATAVGVFWSGDGGARWQPLAGASGGSGAARASAIAGAEVVVPSPHHAQDGALFVGGHSGLFRWQPARPGWEHLLSGSRVLALSVVPGGAPGDAIARADLAGLTLLAGTEEDGVLLSRDGGRTWTGANPGLLDLTILALAASPAFHHDGLAFAATPSGLYRTRNGADSWRALELDSDDVAVQCLAVSPAFADDRVLLAGTEEHGLLRSDDGGRSWESVAELAERSINAVAFLPAIGLEGSGGRAIAATDAGIALSEDGGASWRPVGGALGATLCAAEVTSSVLLAGLPDAGVSRSVDGGATWTAANAGLHASLLVALACSPGFAEDQTLYAASLGRGVSVSRDGGRTWADANDGLADLTVSQIVAVPGPAGSAGLRETSRLGAGVLFASTGAGPFVSRDNAASWQPTFPDDDAVDDAPTVPGSDAADDAPAIVAAAPGGRGLLVAHAGRLLLSADAGATWTPLTSPFREARVVALALSPTFDRDGILYAAVAGVTRSDGTADLTIWCYGRPGARWERLLDERTSDTVQLAVVADGSPGGTLLVGLGARLLRPRANAVEIRGGVRRLVWDTTALPGTLAGLAVTPADTPVQTGHAPGRAVYAATGAGIVRSLDGGATFADWGDGLGQAGTVAAAVSPSYAQDRLVFAVGLGGTVWRRRSD